MKTIIQPKKVKFTCDNCGDIPDCGVDCEVTFNFGYGSERDGDTCQVHFCTECAEEFWDSFKRLYPKFKLTERP